MVQAADSVSTMLAPAGQRARTAAADHGAAWSGARSSRSLPGNGSGRRRPWQWPGVEEIATARDGQFDGTVWRCRCPSHEDEGRGLSLGQWQGHPLVSCEAGCSPRELAWALHRLGLWPDEGPRRPWQLRRRPAPIPRIATREYAHKLWRVCQPAIGTLGEAYLRGLGICHPVPVTFRFATRLEHWPSGAAYPALVCAMQDAHGRFSGVQQIFLDGPAPAPVSPARMIVGEPGVIRLAVPDGGALTVATDVETGLLLVSDRPSPPVWACAVPEALRRLVLPPQIRQVNLALGQNGVRPVLRLAAIALTERLLDESRTVRWFQPPVPVPVADESPGAAYG
jgi:hypothetical protein